MSTSINNSLQQRLQEALYIERYSNGHSKECSLSIPEIRSSMFPPKCICKESKEDGK